MKTYGYSPTETARLKELKSLVSVRVDEYSEQADEVGDNDVNLGDIEFELNKSARKVVSDITRQIGFRSAVDISEYLAVLSGNHSGGKIPLPEDYVRFVSLKLSDWEISADQLISDQSRAYRQQQYKWRRGTPEQPKAFLRPLKDAAYDAGIVPDLTVFCTVKTAPNVADNEYIGVGHAVTEAAGGGGITGTVKDVTDPDYVQVTVSADTLSVGDDLESDNNSWVLNVKFVAGDTVNRPGHDQAIEFWPLKASDTIEHFMYIPYHRAVDLPEYVEDPLIWYTTYKILQTAERFESAKAAYLQYEASKDEVNSGFKGESSGQTG